MEIKQLKKNEIAQFIALIEIFKTVFEHDDPTADSEQLSKLLSNPDFIVFVVLLNNEVVGGLTIYLLHSYFNSKPIVYIYDVGISPQHQGKGFGKALLNEVGNFCIQNNVEEAYVEAESDDIDAIQFYRKTKPSNEMNAVHFTYTFDDNK
jgi:aminoglycoside 3-N-acetyltransferase I